MIRSGGHKTLRSISDLIEVMKIAKKMYCHSVHFNPTNTLRETNW